MINTLSKYLLAGLAACFTVLPSSARLDEGTYDLLRLVESYGVDIPVSYTHLTLPTILRV